VAKNETKVTVGIPTFNRSGFLRESMASVLSQSFRDFRLLVCDNASEDDTPDVVASFADPRITYSRSDRNIGMIGNFNRVIELADTEFLVLLPDDDILYPDYLSSVVSVLERYPNVGVAHTACDLIDGESRVIERGRALMPTREPVSVEPRDRYLERSMRLTWTVCWPSALFRTSAIVAADGLRVDEEPLADVPLLMRIALDWDFAYLSESLVGFRLHAAAATADLGSFTGTGYELLDEQPGILFDQRTRFLSEAGLSQRQTDRYRSIAERAFRAEKVHRLANKAGLGAPWTSTNSRLLELINADGRTLLVPETWQLIAAQLGGRQARRIARRVSRARANHTTVHGHA
jgi:glycosyltransferase involved in cell wall biosynthesis